MFHDFVFFVSRADRVKSLELDKAESMMPTPRDPERYSFWVPTTLIPFYMKDRIMVSIVSLWQMYVSACYSNKSEAIGKIATPSHERYKRGIDFHPLL